MSGVCIKTCKRSCLQSEWVSHYKENAHGLNHHLAQICWYDSQFFLFNKRASSFISLLAFKADIFVVFFLNSVTSKLKPAITVTHSSLLPEISNKCSLHTQNTLEDHQVFLCHSECFPLSSPERWNWVPSTCWVWLEQLHCCSSLPSSWCNNYCRTGQSLLEEGWENVL